METIKEKIPDIEQGLVNELFRRKWVVYAKRPFGNPSSVIEYLGRYTHKIAISNHRILSIENGKVTFSYKDYRQGGKKQAMTLGGMEFIRRFCMHILPKGFVRIRHYGILSSTSKKTTLPAIKEQLPPQTLLKREERKMHLFNPAVCPHCKTATMVTVELFSGRSPPPVYQEKKYE